MFSPSHRLGQTCHFSASTSGSGAPGLRTQTALTAEVEALEPRLLMAAYFVRADGAATTLASAGGPASDPAHCLSMSRANSAAFAPGDTVWFSSAGGAFSTPLLPTAFGAPESPVTYAAIPGEATGRAGISFLSGCPVKASGAHDIVVDGFTVTAANDAGVYLSGLATNVTLRNLAIDTSSYGILVYDKSDGLVIEDVAISSRIGTYALYVVSAASPSRDLTVRRFTAGAGTVRIRQVTDVTVEDFQLSNPNNGLLIETCQGLLSVTDGSITGSRGTGLCISGSTFTEALVDSLVVSGAAATGVQISDSAHIDFTNCASVGGTGTANGFRVSGVCSDILFEDCLASDNAGDGYDTTNPGAHDVTFRRCQALYNGTKTDASKSSGDGFSCHDNNYNIVMESCVAIGNFVSGVAMVGTSAGTITGCTFLNNGGDWTSEGGQRMERGGFCFGLAGPNANGSSWTARDNIVAGNYPCEVNAGSALVASLINLDYNTYYSSPAALGFAKLTDQPVYVSWATYAPREAHSTYAPPILDEIRGAVWNDLDADGLRDAGEPNLPGRTVFLDDDADGALDPAESAVLTGADGRYAFTGLPAGQYVVAQLQPPLWGQTAPAPGTGRPVTVGGESLPLTVDFGTAVASAAPGRPALLSECDSGPDACDCLTNRDNGDAAPERIAGFMIPGIGPGAAVSLYVDGVLVGEAACPDGGCVTIWTSGQYHWPDGGHLVSARQQEPGKAQSADSSSLALQIDTEAPSLSAETWACGDPSATLDGTVDDPEASIVVTVNGLPFQAINDGDGTWSLAMEAIVPALSQGLHDVDVTASDPAGNAATASGLLIVYELPGDANLDGLVDLQDFSVLKDRFGCSGSIWCDGDFNADGMVDLQDFGILKDHFGQSSSLEAAPSAPAATPDARFALPTQSLPIAPTIPGDSDETATDPDVQTLWDALESMAIPTNLQVIAWA